MAETLLASLPEQDQTQSLYSVHTAAPAQACFLGWSPSRQGVAARAGKGSQRCLHLLSRGRHEKGGVSMLTHTDIRNEEQACFRAPRESMVRGSMLQDTREEYFMLPDTREE